jgi:hypothetical protein
METHNVSDHTTPHVITLHENDMIDFSLLKQLYIGFGYTTNGFPELDCVMDIPSDGDHEILGPGHHDDDKNLWSKHGIKSHKGFWEKHHAHDEAGFIIDCEKLNHNCYFTLMVKDNRNVATLDQVYLRVEDAKTNTPLCTFRPHHDPDAQAIILGGLVRFGNNINLLAAGKKIKPSKASNLPKITQLCHLESVPGPKIIIKSVANLKKGKFEIGNNTLLSVEWAGRKHISHVVHKSTNPVWNFVIPILPNEESRGMLEGVVKKHGVSHDHEIGTFTVNLDVEHSSEFTVPLMIPNSEEKTKKMTVTIAIQGRQK